MQHLSAALEALVTSVAGQFEKANFTGWHLRPQPDKWSKKEIVGHLVDSAMNNLQRFVRGTYQKDFHFVYDQDAWVAAQHYKEAELSELIALWRLLNKQIIRVWATYPEDRATINVNTGKTEDEFHTIEFLAEDYIRHLQHHAGQLFPD